MTQSELSELQKLIEKYQLWMSEDQRYLLLKALRELRDNAE